MEVNDGQDGVEEDCGEGQGSRGAVEPGDRERESITEENPKNESTYMIRIGFFLHNILNIYIYCVLLR